MINPHDIIIEMIPSGKFVKVTAIDVRTGREVSIVGDAKATQNNLRKIAVDKLNYVVSKEQKAQEELQKTQRRRRGFEV